MERRPKRNEAAMFPCDTFSLPFGGVAFAFEEHVGFADGEGFGADFLGVKGFEGFFGDGEHAAGAAGAIV